MKKLLFIISSLIIICTGCADDLGLSEDYGEGFVLTINSGQITKATTNIGTEYERELRTLDCFFYPKGQTDSPCVFYHRATVNNSTGQVVVPIYVVEDAIRKIFPTDNTCDIFVIANLPDSVIPDGVTFDGNGTNEHTKLENLCNYMLQIKDPQDTEFAAEYDALGKPFVMAGLATGQKDSKKNASATVNLRRAASKVTLTVSIPEYLQVKDKQGTLVTMLPQFELNQNEVALQCAFHNGTYKGYLNKDADITVDTCLFSTEEKGLTYVKKIDAVKSKLTPELDSIPAKRVYKCEVPFYTYARAWAKGAADAAYMTFKMPWGYDKGDNKGITYDTYYYQILINGANRSFLPNNWYDMSVNIGVIGSAIENVPIVIDHQLLYVLDWTDEISGYDHPDEDVVLETYTYFIVNQKLIEIENENYTDINFHASHTVAWEITNAYYYNNSGVTSRTVNITKSAISITNPRKGVLGYLYNIPDDIYSPIYVDLKMWLDFDKDGHIDDNEEDFVETVSIIQYPMMYVVRDESSLRSVYVNATQHHSTSNGTLGNHTITVGGTTYNLGSGSGVRNHDSVSLDTDGDGTNDTNTNNHRYSYPMYIISVSSFDATDKFTGPQLNNSGYLNITGRTDEANITQKAEYNYIIGDPRQRTNAMNLTTSPFYTVRDSWADDYYGKKLKYYYPTDGDGNSFQVVAPKFRIVSFNNASTGVCDTHGAALRCASLQEDGIPAGRWRLPTVAEVKYIIKLQKDGAIQPIFTSSNSNYATAAYTNANHTNLITLTLTSNDKNADYRWNSLNSNISVRCVYDEWYWGSEREAVKNDSPSKRHDTNETQYRQDYLGNQIYFDKYFFTWGDREIIW